MFTGVWLIIFSIIYCALIVSVLLKQKEKVSKMKSIIKYCYKKYQHQGNERWYIFLYLGLSRLSDIW